MPKQRIASHLAGQDAYRVPADNLPVRNCRNAVRRASEWASGAWKFFEFDIYKPSISTDPSKLAYKSDLVSTMMTRARSVWFRMNFFGWAEAFVNKPQVQSKLNSDACAWDKNVCLNPVKVVHDLHFWWGSHVPVVVVDEPLCVLDEEQIAIDVGRSASATCCFRPCFMIRW